LTNSMELFVFLGIFLVNIIQTCVSSTSSLSN
jgi:hypothetical protein